MNFQSKDSAAGFPEHALTAEAIFFRSYSRRTETGQKESWQEAIERQAKGMSALGKFTPYEAELVYQQALQVKSLPSGRWFWVGGTDHILKPENFPSAYNCLQGDTLVDTYEDGDVKIKDLVGKTVHVLNGNNVRVPVEFKSYGVQPLMEITLQKYMSHEPSVTIQATPNHNWLLTGGKTEEGKWVETSGLLTGSFIKGSEDLKWRVLAVHDLEIEEEVFCCEEPETHSFVLSWGILTGNCSSTAVTDWDAFGYMMDLAMQGCGTGAVLTPENIDQLPAICNQITVEVMDEPGESWEKHDRWGFSGNTIVIQGDDRESIFPEDMWEDFQDGHFYIHVGDSRQGWVDAYLELLRIASCPYAKEKNPTVHVYLGRVRPKGVLLKGFGGVANPVELPKMFKRVGEILKKAYGRKLDTLEACLLIDEAASCIVAGSIRRSAGIRQGSDSDALFASAKQNLWMQNSEGKWLIDPDRDALRMANHTRVFMHKPSYAECLKSVTDQYNSGEGALQYAPVALARASADILDCPEKVAMFQKVFDIEDPTEREIKAKNLLLQFDDGNILGRDWQKLKMQNREECIEAELSDRLKRFGMNPCLTAGTMVITRHGHFPIEDLVGKVVEIWDGTQWVKIDNFRITGENQPVFTVNFGSGQSVTATAYHKFILEDGQRVELKNLKVGDRLMTHDTRIHGIHHEPAAYLKGFLVGDGTIRGGIVALDLYEPKYGCIERLIKSASEMTAKELIAQGIAVRAKSSRERGSTDIGFNEPSVNRKRRMTGLASLDRSLRNWCDEYRKTFPMEILNWDLPSKLEFIAGCMDADGTSQDHEGCRYQITSIHKEWLSGFQLLLQTVGVKSKLNLSKKAEMKDFGHRGGVYETQPLYRLTISQAFSIILAKQVIFTRLASFASRAMKNKRKDSLNRIASIEFSHTAEEVYCATVPTNNSFALSNSLLVGNCGEILLNDNFCNLSQVHLDQINPLDTEAQEDAFHAATLNVAALLHHEFTVSRYQQSRILDPIVGVSFTGLFDFFVNLFGSEWLRWWQAGRPQDWEKTERGHLMTQFKRLAKTTQLEHFASLSDYFEARERDYLEWWKTIVRDHLFEYCDRHGLKRPNRYTTVSLIGPKLF